jgi:hypothetical protein
METRYAVEGVYGLKQLDHNIPMYAQKIEFSMEEHTKYSKIEYQLMQDIV